MDKSENKLIANTLFVTVILLHVAGVVYFHSQAPANTVDGPGTIEVINSLLVWYTSIAIICLVSLIFRLKHIRDLSGAGKATNVLLGGVMLVPVLLYVYLLYANIT